MEILERLASIGADFWDCSEETELLTHDSPDCALEYHVECLLRRPHGPDVEAQIRALGPLSIWPWKRKTLDVDYWVPDLTDHLLEVAEEYLSENTELADPDGDQPLLPEEAVKRQRPVLEAILRSLCSEAQVWACDRGDPVVLTPDEVVELLRNHCPEWIATTEEASGNPAVV